MEIGYIKPREITSEMKESYLAYAMSVIVSRALPDVRDGMKPVHRRILFAMRELGLTHSAKYRKSATVVGEVLGKYHPHGDTAVYDSMVRLAQDFSMRYPLVDGQGNFGSMDGDNAAAMRYTEAKLTSLAEEMMADIEKDTVDFVPNYDASRKEPSVLPAKAPQLLLNGTMGIAVGMATNIPPHNLGELVDGIAHIIENPDCEVKDLVKFVKGPDFPTGGTIYNQSDINQAYLTGRGSIVTRAEAEIVETKNGQFQIIVTEMTYASNKATTITKIAELVKTGKLEGIRDIRDESDKDGVRIVIELKKEAFPKKILNKLYTLTDLQKSFHVNMLALVDGIEPKILNLKAALEHFIEHRKVVVTRRTKFDLEKAKDRAHILEGLKKALDRIDAVISVIRKSATKEIAHQNLMKRFKLSDKQSAAILEMRLQTLAGLERKKIEDELKEKKRLIAELEDLLKSPKKILGVIKKELQDLKEKYGDERKTRVVKSAVGEFKQEDLIPNEETIIVLTEDDYVKRMPPSLYRVQKRGGKGVIGATTKEGDTIDKVVSAMTHDDLFFFTNSGKVFQSKAYEIPVSSRTAKGQAIVNFLQVAPGENITAIISTGRDSEAKYLFMATKSGTVKKSAISDFEKVRRSGLIAINLPKDDELRWISPTTGKDEVIITTSGGQAIHFKETDVRPMGRGAAGVRGIRLKKDDEVVGMDVVLKNQKGNQLLVFAQNGFGKRSDLKGYKIQKRGGSGIKTAKVTSKTGKLVSAHIVNTDNLETDLICSSAKGQIIRVPLKSVPALGRATQGVRVMRFNADDKIAATAVL
ncbi:MAG: gyrase subunit A protein [Candidatus Moranbacteria bacterium GW2011_GWC1_45_18]|nr:MAG: gyrase subunit A protein [Candidatus Moranbacteria bacterium GW2011_GWC2_40_12]KKT71754.1 MAG: gyrase subunit A protein [Candidatus Moranbacteria bacterium GW2011_GWF1_44_4]KKU00721.1 MAG: gyrase subunit A protein [Candidatus Moranbacteria bacterium GW2011_GWC1_45_18]HBB37270.1 DNA gyrase subunit A [Candidatus Moranbacteria bacterium]HBU25223.1 DNA gyrase subunit A [Candidatus Moranbacteria bacterium]